MTENVISNNISASTVLSDQVWLTYPWLGFEKLIVFIYGFSIKVTSTETWEK